MSDLLNIIPRFKNAMEALSDSGKREFIAQGHRASGKGIASFEVVTTQGLDKLIGFILVNDYLVPVDTGVSASRVPYRRGSGVGKSKYIQGLLDWADIVKPGLTDKARLSFVFAVANTHKREGIPSNGSYAFTSNGRRTEWIKNSFETQAAQDDFLEVLDLINLVTVSFERAITSASNGS